MPPIIAASGACLSARHRRQSGRTMAAAKLNPCLAGGIPMVARFSVLAVWFLLAGGIGFAGDPTHEFFTASDGVKIHYLVQGQGTPVILIHGFSGNAEG